MHNTGGAKNLIIKKLEYQNRINEVAHIMTKTWVTLQASVKHRRRYVRKGDPYGCMALMNNWSW